MKVSNKLKALLLFFCLLVSIELYSQAPLPLRDSSFTIEMCGGIDTLWTLPYIEQGVQYRWEPTTGIVQNINSATTIISAENLTQQVISYSYLLTRTYNSQSPEFYHLTDTITIRVWPEPNGTLETTNFSLCPGDSTILYYTPSSGSYLSMFPSNTTFLDTSNSPRMFLFPTVSTTYQTYFTNPGGCLRGPFEVSVNVGPPPPVFTIDFPNIVCNTSDLIKLFQFVDPPGQGVYTGTGIINDTVFSPQLAGIGAHPITYTINYLSCTFSLTDTIFVISPGGISMTDMPNFCLADPKFLLNIGTPPGGDYTGNGIEEGFFIPEAAGVGAHVVTYSVGFDEYCIAETSQIVNVIPSPPKPTLSAEPPIFALCDGDSIRLTSSFYPNYFWNSGQTEQSIYASEAGNYFVRVANSSGCASYSDTIRIIVGSRPVIDTLYSPILANGYNLSAYTSADGLIELEVSGGTLPYSFLWSTGAETEDIAFLAAGDYSIEITDSIGCSVTGSITLTQPEEPSINPPGSLEFSLPNAFTPNGDGFNDTYKINKLFPDYIENKFMVWDIARRLVFRAENYDNTWAGLDNSGKKLPAGTYFAVFECPKLNGPVKAFIDLRYE